MQLLLTQDVVQCSHLLSCAGLVWAVPWAGDCGWATDFDHTKFWDRSAASIRSPYSCSGQTWSFTYWSAEPGIELDQSRVSSCYFLIDELSYVSFSASYIDPVAYAWSTISLKHDESEIYFFAGSLHLVWWRGYKWFRNIDFMNIWSALQNGKRVLLLKMGVY